MDIVTSAVQGFFDRYPAAMDLGNKTSPDAFEALSGKIKKVIPGWYKDLLIRFPIANLALGIPNDFGQPLLKGRPMNQLPLMEITFNSVEKIEELSDSGFPYLFLPKRSMIGIANETWTTGEEIFIDATRPNPPVILSFHEAMETIRVMISNGERLVDQFSDLFDLGRLDNRRIKLSEANREKGITIIRQFVDMLDAEIRDGGDLLIAGLPTPHRLTESIQVRDQELNKGDYVSALLTFEYGLEDSGYPISEEQLTLLTQAYTICGLHLPELVYLEERVKGRG